MFFIFEHTEELASDLNQPHCEPMLITDVNIQKSTINRKLKFNLLKKGSHHRACLNKYCREIFGENLFENFRSNKQSRPLTGS